MLNYAGLSCKFRTEAVRNTVYVLNATGTSSLDGKVPFEAFYGKKPSVAHCNIPLYVFRTDSETTTFLKKT